MIDPHPWTTDHTRSTELVDVSKDGKLLIYAIREGGRDEVSYRVFDIDEGEDLPDLLTAARYFGAEFTPDGRGFYYTRYDSQGPRVYFHSLGTDPGKDMYVFGDGYGGDMLMFASLSNDGHFLLVHVLHGSAGPTQLHVKELRRGGGFRAATLGEDGSRSFAEIANGKLIIHTDWQAPTGRVMVADARHPERSNWREIIPANPDAVLRSMTLAGGRIFVNYLEDVQSRVKSYDLTGKTLGEIRFDSIGTVGGVLGRWDDSESFFSFQSFHIPNTIYRYDIPSGRQTVWSRTEVPINTADYEVNQVWYSSKDGTRVPMFLVRRKDLEKNGNSPTVLSGYGGFDVSRLPRFRPTIIPWLDAGGIYAVANIRGGGEFGEKWHRAGMLEKKQNCFDDFIAAAEYLIKEGHTDSRHLAISGGSNGGLLVGAVMTQRPDLVKAVICAYPLLDMVRYHKFLVARFWVPEYGSSEDPDQFKVLYAYSPYHHVEPGTAYPALLMITGDGDTRVAPLHGRKMVAAVQSANASDNPILLRYHTKAGHAGGTPVSEQIEDAVDAYSFLAWQLGVENLAHGS